MSTTLCLTCSSSLPPPTQYSAHGIYITPCCVKPICRNCTTSNPRLREYDPCLRCGDLVTSSGVARVERGIARRQREREEREDVFRIEDSDEEVDAGDGDAPPGYDQVVRDALNRADGHGGDRDESGQDRDHLNGGQVDKGDKAKNEKEQEMEIVEVRHPVSRNDTILAIARRYAADVGLLLPSCMGANPSRTRSCSSTTSLHQYFPSNRISCELAKRS